MPRGSGSIPAAPTARALSALAAVRYHGHGLGPTGSTGCSPIAPPVLRLVRDVGLGLVDRVPNLKRLFIREAAGLVGDVPKLLRGKSL